MFSKNNHLSEIFLKSKEKLIKKEELEENVIYNGLNCGSMVLLGNINHKNVEPLLIGQPAKIKINANIGTSPLICKIDEEMEKLKTAEQAGADTYMDLSTGGDLDEIRKNMMSLSHMPIGTVPIYSAAKKWQDMGKSMDNLDMKYVFEEIEYQAESGVDYMTIHTGLDIEAVKYAYEYRLTGIVSRGGAMIANYMLKNNKENPLLKDFERILKIAKKYNVTLSLGDGLRPGSLKDAGDFAQNKEVLNLSKQVLQARNYGVQVMVEGPGHVPFDQIATNMKLQKSLCHNAPFYVLGPLVTDVAPGYDHITAAIGGTMAAANGADFLCYVTPAEHLALPNNQDVKDGVIVTRIAAHAADIVKGVPGAKDWDLKMAKARKQLDWEAQLNLAIDPQTAREKRASRNPEGTTACSMCGDYCAVEIVNKYLGSTIEHC